MNELNRANLMYSRVNREQTMRLPPFIAALLDPGFVRAGTASEGLVSATRPQDTFGLSAPCQPAGTLFAAVLQPPVYTPNNPVNGVTDAAHVAQVRHWPAIRALTHCSGEYRTVARSVPPLQASDAAFEGVGPIFVRFAQGRTANVAAAKLDIFFALGQAGARLFELLATPSVREAFVEANGEEAAELVQNEARGVFVDAHNALQTLGTGLASWAMAQIQHLYLSLPMPDPAAAFSPPLWARHEQAMAWPHGPSVAGSLFQGPLVEPNQLGWFRSKLPWLKWIT